jgi:perosamine synthetase
MKKRSNIPFHKAYVDDREIKNVISAIKSGWHTMGPRTVEFENKFGKYVGAKYAISVNSCTAALHLALEAIGVKEGDEVIVPAVTFTATAEVVCYFKAKPVLIDVEKDTLNIDVSKVEEKITKKTKAIISVDYAGQPVDYDELKKITRRHKLYLIEDAAHTLPSFYKGKSVGTLADITCFSFYATKTLSTGEGGMITTNNKKWAERMKVMRLHGMSRDAWKRYSGKGHWYYEVIEAGFKYNTTDINSALGLAQLNKLKLMWQKRKAIAAAYNKAFKNLPEIVVPEIKPDRETSWHLYVIKLNLGRLQIGRNDFIEQLAKKGVGSSVHFIPLYRHPFYKNKFNYRINDFPASEWAYERIISLPIYPGMTALQIGYVISCIQKIIQLYRKCN